MENSSWEKHVEALKAFHAAKGHFRVPQRHVGGLGQWLGKVKRQRATLTNEQTSSLQAIGFDDWETGKERWDRQWDEMFDRLVAYKNEKGNDLVSQNDAQHRDLGAWVQHQRILNKHGTLREDRKQRLEEFGFSWVADERLNWKAGRNTDSIDEEWERMFRQLATFRQETGHCLVPKQLSGKKQLARWVDKQRTDLVEGVMRPERKQKLDSIGFVWQVDHCDSDKSLDQRRWEDMFEKLKEYKETFGDFIIRKGCCDEEEKLGKWVSHQRRSKRIGKLPLHREAKLNAIGFAWVAEKEEEKEEHWNEMFGELKEYKSTFGDCIVPKGYCGVPRLAKWVRYQRSCKRKGKLPLHREAKLTAIGFAWNPDTSQGIASRKRVHQQNPNHLLPTKKKKTSPGKIDEFEVHAV